jgi:hypothetical protein
MMTVSKSWLLSGLLRAASSATLYPQSAAQRLPTLLLDFQKNNVSSSWAPGHPKEWSDKTALKYEFSDGGPFTWTSGAIRAAELTSDEKLLVTINATNHLAVVEFATGTTVSGLTLASTYAYGPSALRVLGNSAGGHDILVSMDYNEVHRLRLTSNGTRIGNTTVYPGGLVWERGSLSISQSGRRFFTVNSTVLYDLDDGLIGSTDGKEWDSYRKSEVSRSSVAHKTKMNFADKTK